MNHLISPGELRKIVGSAVIYDCRYRLTEPGWGFEQYRSGHIPGAFFFDLNEDMASGVGEHGGRHPLPDFQDFIMKIEGTGINDETMVVCYDDNLSGAARMWFLLKYIGHDNCYILNGGIDDWISSGGPVEKGVRDKNLNGVIHPKYRDDLVADHGFIWAHRNEIELVDARENYRYRGESEPIDRIPGRIPGSINIPYLDLVDGARFREDDELRRILKGIDRRPVMYCGSGVTSCVNFFAMDSLGMHPVLYAGSYSDWISYTENPVEKDVS